MKQLGDFQRYLIEEFVEDWREGHMSRRDMVRRTVYLTGGAASAATVLVSMGCSPAAAPTAIPAPPTAAPVAPTKPAVLADPTKPAAPAAPATSAVATAAPTAPATAAPAATTAPAKPADPTKPAAPAGTPQAAAAPAPPPPTPSGPRSPLSVKADDPAIEAKMVEIPGEAGTVFGYFARPKAPGSYAGLVVIHENRGITEHIMDVTRRAAKEGFFALAVDLLSRNGGTAKVTDPAQAGGFLGNAKPDDLVADLSSGVKYLQSVDSVKKDKMGVFGFCFGGGYAWRLATMNKEIKAAAPFYGIAPPLETIPGSNAVFLGIYAGNDTRVNASIAPLEEALKKANKSYEMKILPDVNHGFNNDTGASWNEKAAGEAWQSTITFFKKNLA